MAKSMSILDQFTELVNTIPVEDSVQPGLAAIAQHEIETPIAISTQPSEQVAPADSSITQLHAAYAGGSLTARELVRDLIERIDDRDLLVLGWVTIAPNVVEQAEQCDTLLATNNPNKPLMGIPIGIKDLVDVAGMPTLCGSGHGLPDAVDSDAPAITRLRDAGAIIMGKTTTHEYAFGGTTPPTRNPWQLDRIPGGSSGGSGAVLGAGMVPGAIGTDTAGSVRIPASYCGAVGFMGSYGSVPTNSVAVLAWSLDHVGAMARSVSDVAIMHKVIAALPNPGTPLVPGLPATIGIPRQVLEPMHPSVRTAFDAAVSALEQRGVKVIEVPWPDPDLLEAVGFILMMTESAAFHQDRMKHPELFDPQVAQLLEAGASVSATDHLQALRVRVQLAQWFDNLFASTPVLLTPTLPCLPPPLGSDTFTPVDLGSETQPLATAHTRFPMAANIAGVPAGSLPCGLQDGFPIGLQVMGRRGSDLGVLSVMYGIEQVLAQEGLWQQGAISQQFGGLK
jgi:aspartyl-tRNA(Asn)/glutamyl-tRNA(Gln) amidotransferase subunit A